MTTHQDAASVVTRGAKAERRRELDDLDTGALREAVNWFLLPRGTSNVIMRRTVAGHLPPAFRELPVRRDLRDVRRRLSRGRPLF